MAATTPATAPWRLGGGPARHFFAGYNWELYNVATDWTENNDMAAKYPGKLKELQALFYSEAKHHNVYPLDNASRSGVRPVSHVMPPVEDDADAASRNRVGVADSARQEG